jgi:hypothetical protein
VAGQELALSSAIRKKPVGVPGEGLVRSRRIAGVVTWPKVMSVGWFEA